MSFQPALSFNIWDSFWSDKLDGLIMNKAIAVPVPEDTEERELSLPQQTDFYCRTCDIKLDSRSEQVVHYKSAQHRRRIKSKLRSKNESESDSSGDDSSDDEDSSSDWSGDETIATSANLDAAQDAWKGRPRQEVHFFNEREEKITAYRAMVASRSELLNEFDILNRLAQTRNDFIKKIDGDRYDAVLLFAAGAFAGCIFVNGEPAVHRVIKKYVVRAGRGTAQSVRDNKNQSKPKSMGAQLRRENEKVLLQKINEQIIDWMGDLKKCKTIFVRAPKHQKWTILQPLHQFIDDKNIIRPCPCPMHKPRFKEVVRMFSKIFSLKLTKPGQTVSTEVQNEPTQDNDVVNTTEFQKPLSEDHESDEEEEESALHTEDVIESTEHLKLYDGTKKSRKKQNNKITKPREQPSEIVPSDEDRFKGVLDELFTAVKGNNAAHVDQVIQRLKTEQPSDVSIILNMSLPPTEKRLLHVAAETGSENCITVLLANGADPSVKNGDGVPPFRVCETREVRAAFWTFRANDPDRYNWSKAEIPDPAQIKANPTGRKRPKRKRKPKESEAEKIVAPVKNPCDECGTEISDIPFKYCDFKFCTCTCLRAHRFSAKK